MSPSHAFSSPAFRRVSRRAFLGSLAAAVPLAAAGQGPTLLPPESLGDDLAPSPFRPDGTPPRRDKPLPDPFRPAETYRSDGGRPTGDDYSARGLWDYEESLVARYGGPDKVPTAVKADHFAWVLARYHQAPTGLVHETSVLAPRPGVPPWHQFGDDVVTWNGAVLAAMGYRYAVTGDAEAIAVIGRILDGLRLAITVTGSPGLVARCVVRSDQPLEGATLKYVAPDGTVYHYRSDAAKGTYNQLCGGLAVAGLLAGTGLPPERRRQLREILGELALHVVNHEYRLTERDGRKTEFGDMRPRLGPIGVPFNAQVAYLVVAAGMALPPADPAARATLAKAFEELRNEHHVYYENPRFGIFPPQRIGDSPLVKGMNDRNHVMNAAYHGLFIELHTAAREGRSPDATFLHQLGQTLYWGGSKLRGERNALCDFMWAGLLRDANVANAVVPDPNERNNVIAAVRVGAAEGREQLRRWPVHRFRTPGELVKTEERYWSDTMHPHETYLWKAGPNFLWKPAGTWDKTGPPNPRVNVSTDYLHAYWLMRYWRLDATA